MYTEEQNNNQSFCQPLKNQTEQLIRNCRRQYKKKHTTNMIYKKVKLEWQCQRIKTFKKSIKLKSLNHTGLQCTKQTLLIALLMFIRFWTHGVVANNVNALALDVK